MTKLCVCDEIECPFIKLLAPNSSSGCRYYFSSSRCHLLKISDNKQNMSAGEGYWLSCNKGDVDLVAVKNQNDEFIQNNSRMIQQLSLEEED